MTLSQDEILQIMKMVEESDFGELCLETGELKLVVRKKGYVASAPDGAPQHGRAAEPEARRPAIPDTAVPPSAAKKSTQTVDHTGTTPIKSPMLGTVYRRPSPDAPPYIEVGSFVKEDDTVCLIEVMKVFTAVKAGVRGYVEEILVETNEMVEYGQPLFLVRPGAEPPKKD